MPEDPFFHANGHDMKWLMSWSHGSSPKLVCSFGTAGGGWFHPSGLRRVEAPSSGAGAGATRCGTVQALSAGASSAEAASVWHSMMEIGRSVWGLGPKSPVPQYCVVRGFPFPDRERSWPNYAPSHETGGASAEFAPAEVVGRSLS